MNTASRELCQELYELSGWDDTLLRYHDSKYLAGNIGVNTVYENLVSVNDNLVGCDECEGQYAEKSLPAYDLSYLLRKIPSENPHNGLHCTFGVTKSLGGKANDCLASWECDSGQYEIQYAHNPEDALANLIIQLFKAGILTTDEPTNQKA